MGILKDAYKLARDSNHDLKPFFQAATGTFLLGSLTTGLALMCADDLSGDFNTLGGIAIVSAVGGEAAFAFIFGPMILINADLAVTPAFIPEAMRQRRKFNKAPEPDFPTREI